MTPRPAASEAVADVAGLGLGRVRPKPARIGGREPRPRRDLRAQFGPPKNVI